MLSCCSAVLLFCRHVVMPSCRHAVMPSCRVELDIAFRILHYRSTTMRVADPGRVMTYDRAVILFMRMDRHDKGAYAYSLQRRDGASPDRDQPRPSPTAQWHIYCMYSVLDGPTAYLAGRNAGWECGRDGGWGAIKLRPTPGSNTLMRRIISLPCSAFRVVSFRFVSFRFISFRLMDSFPEFHGKLTSG
jgi:hypothetical protein